MKRREFNKLLGIGATAIIVTPSVIASSKERDFKVVLHYLTYVNKDGYAVKYRYSHSGLYLSETKLIQKQDEYFKDMVNRTKDKKAPTIIYASGPSRERVSTPSGVIFR